MTKQEIIDMIKTSFYACMDKLKNMNQCTEQNKIMVKMTTIYASLLDSIYECDDFNRELKQELNTKYGMEVK